MGADRVTAERLRILEFWWMFELFSPQQVPAPIRKATRPDDQHISAWQPGDRLPWETR